MRTKIENKVFDAERALYHLCSGDVVGCTFAGPADGESVLKEARDITLQGCSFSLRYPLWHVEGFTLDRCTMDQQTRAAIWYASHGRITNCDLGGIKAVRECQDISLTHCHIQSEEFGWKSRKVSLTDSQIQSQYLFFDSRDVELTMYICRENTPSSM